MYHYLSIPYSVPIDIPLNPCDKKGLRTAVCTLSLRAEAAVSLNLADLGNWESPNEYS
jgi:hypothetical protein